jgi:hypothetical protein
MPTRRTNRGQSIDMDSLLSANKSIPAVGNMKVNANGDVIDGKGNIVKRNEERVREYYRDNPKSSTSGVSLKGEQQQLRPDEVNTQQAPKTARTAQASTPVADPIQQPDEFDAPAEQEPIGYKEVAEQEPIGYKEVHLPSGDIEMVPIYRDSSDDQ